MTTDEGNMGSTAVDYDTHAEVLLALPWYVNGTLDAGQAQTVRRHLGLCLRCRAELLAQQRLAARVRADDVDSVAAQLAFERLRSRIQPGAPVDGAARRPWRDGPGALLSRLLAPRGAPFALAAGVALGVCALLLLPVREAPLPGADTDAFEVLGSGQGTIQDANTLWVRFEDGLPEARIAEIAGGVGGVARRISASSPVYAITFGAAAGADVRAEQVLRQLRATAGVAYAMPAGGPRQEASDG